MNIFIDPNPHIDFDKKIIYVFHHNLLDENLYRYIKNNNVDNLKIKLVDYLRIEIPKLFQNINNFSEAIKLIDLLNCKIKVLKYHFSIDIRKMIFEDIINFLLSEQGNNTSNVINIYSLLFDELFKNQNNLALDYLNNFIYLNTTSINQIIIPNITKFIKSTEHYSELCIFLDNMYIKKTNKVFTNFLFNELVSILQNSFVLKKDFNFWILYYDDIYNWLSIPTINSKSKLIFTNIEKIHDDNFNILENADKIYYFLNFKNINKIKLDFHFYSLLNNIKLNPNNIKNGIEKNDLKNILIKKFKNKKIIEELNISIDNLLQKHPKIIYDNLDHLMFLCSLTFQNSDNKLFEDLFLENFKRRAFYLNYNSSFDKIILNIFSSHNVNPVFIRKLKDINYDIEINRCISSEFKNQLTLKYPNEYINDKINIKTFTSNLWNKLNDKKSIIELNEDFLLFSCSDVKNNTVSNLNKYIEAYNKYYRYKFNAKKLNWYTNLGNIKFNYIEDDIKVEINCSPLQYYILENIINIGIIDNTILSKKLNLLNSVIKRKYKLFIRC